jgi:hypothetical protein
VPFSAGPRNCIGIAKSFQFYWPFLTAIYLLIFISSFHVSSFLNRPLFFVYVWDSQLQYLTQTVNCWYLPVCTCTLLYTSTFPTKYWYI